MHSLTKERLWIASEVSWLDNRFLLHWRRGMSGGSVDSAALMHGNEALEILLDSFNLPHNFMKVTFVVVYARIMVTNL